MYPQFLNLMQGNGMEENHIHYYIEGYKPLALAIPLSIDDSFPFKSFDGENDVVKIIQAFGQKINLKTQLSIFIQTKIL